jgi:hypothetical protein
MMKKCLPLIIVLMLADFAYTGTTSNYGWDYGVMGQNPWWNTWAAMWNMVDAELKNRLFITQKTDVSEKMLSFAPANANTGKFNLSFAYAGTYPGSARENKAYIWGYNHTPGGSQEKPGEPVLTNVIETFYSPSTGNEFMEIYIQYLSADGLTGRRPLMFKIDRNTNDVTSLMTSSNQEIYDPATGIPYWSFSPEKFIFSTGRMEFNNLVGIGTNAPFNPLSFGGYLYATGKKLALYESPVGGDLYGFGVGPGGIDMYVSGNNRMSLTETGMTLNGVITASRLTFRKALYFSGGKLAVYEEDDGSGVYGFGITGGSLDIYVNGNKMAAATMTSLETAGDFKSTIAGKGVVLKNAAGTVTKRVRLNDAGDGLIFENE